MTGRTRGQGKLWKSQKKNKSFPDSKMPKTCKVISDDREDKDEGDNNKDDKDKDDTDKGKNGHYTAHRAVVRSVSSY